MGTFLINLV